MRPRFVSCLAAALALAGCVAPAAGDRALGAAGSPASSAEVDAPATAPQRPPPSTIPPRTGDASPSAPPIVLDPFDAEYALAFASTLAEAGTRDAGTPGDLAAQQVVRAAFEEAGWQVTDEVVPLPQGGQTANLLATLGGPSDLDRPHVVIGGHLDTRGGSPGANDNGSGIGVLVALARELADESPGLPIVLVAFGAEEFQPSEPREHHLGSSVYAQARSASVVAALIVDMVGNGPTTCICWYDEGPRSLADRLLAVARASRLDGYDLQRRGDLSDHGPFARQGRPAALLWTFDDGVLHTPQDTSDRLRVEDVRRAGDLALAFVRTLQADDAERLGPGPG